MDEWQPSDKVLVHWDGKLMDTLDSKGTDDHLLILVSGVNGTKLLGVPPLPHLTKKAGLVQGDLISTATKQLLVDWECEQNVIAMVFDTTSSNTDFSLHSRIIYGQKRFIYGLKCFQKDEYPNVEDTEGNAFDSPVYSCKFGASEDTSSLLGLAYEDGKIVLQQTTGPDEGKYLIDKVVHGNAIFDISWVPKKNELISAVADSSVCLWSLEKDLKYIQHFKGHTKSVKCLDVNVWDTAVFASGGRDCNVIIWDTRCQPSHKANEIVGAHPSQKFLNSPIASRTCASQIQNSVISVVFSQQYNLLSAGASDGLLKMWDLRKTYCRGKREPQSLHVLEYAGNSSYRGYTSMRLSPFGEKVYVSCLDGKIYAYHLANPTLIPVAEFFGHRPNTYYGKICLSPCGSYLLSGSSDDKAYIWLTGLPGTPVASLSGHFDEVTSVAWSARNLGMLVTCSDDMKHRIFKYQFIEEDDPETMQNLRGFAVPYQSIRCNHGSPSSSITKTPVSLSINVNRHCLKNICSVFHTNIPSPDFSSINNSTNLEESLQSELHCKATSQMTPSQTQIKSRNEQVTPRTSEGKTLLTWLSSSKTPKSAHVLQTPTSQSSSNNRNVSKRKLIDLMSSDQENLRNENRKPVLSPTKNVLTEKENQSISLPSSGVVKMLKYEESRPETEFTNTDMEDTDSFKLIDGTDKKKISEFSSAFYFNSNNHTPQPTRTISVDDIKTPVKALSPNKLNDKHLSPVNTSSLASPTANLPNYVIDGRSPHNRREPPLTRKRQVDWLTSLGQKKNKYDQRMQHINEEIKKQTKASVTLKRKSRKPNSKKKKKT